MSTEATTPKKDSIGVHQESSGNEDEKEIAAGERKGEYKGKTPVVVPLPHETPAAVRNRRHIQKELHTGSPSDNMLSPCTSKIFGKRTGISGPAAILRNKQQLTIPFKIDDDVDK